MAGSTRVSSCANHLDRAAVGTCAYCGKPVCERCRVEFVAAEQTFCSERCCDAQPREPGQEPVSNATLEAGLKKPIRIGWALSARSTGRIAAHVLPIAVVLGLIFGYMSRPPDGPWAPPAGEAAAFTFILLILLSLAFGVALVGVILSARHAGLVEGAPYAAAARRFVPWVTTLFLMTGITLVGYVALILPGIYLALRLFWADEFALIHNKGPIAALRASWDLTRNQTGAVFIFQFILGLAQWVVLIPVVILFAIVIAGLEAIGLGGGGEDTSGVQLFVLSFVGLVAYGALHGPEIVQFYGMQAAKSNLEAGIAPVAGRRTSGWLVAAVVVMAATVGIGFIAAIAIPNLLNAIDRGKQKRTLADSSAIAVAMESYAADHDQYPQAESIAELERQLVPDHIEAMPVVDGWGNPFRVVSTPMEYEIRSPGKDGVFETLPPRGATHLFKDDIVWRNREIVQWPGDLKRQ